MCVNSLVTYKKLLSYLSILRRNGDVQNKYKENKNLLGQNWSLSFVIASLIDCDDFVSPFQPT